MPTTYELADKATRHVVESMMKKYHGELTDAGVTFCVTAASAERNEAGEIEANPVTVAGYARPAKIKIFSLQERAEKQPDFRITIDAQQWENATPAQRDAIIDGQLERLELKKDSNNVVMPDDLGRPKLKLKKWDHCYQWFDSVAARHGTASVEVQEAKAFFDEHGQAWFGPMLWDSPDAPAKPTAAEALNTLTGGNGQSATDAAPDAKPKKGRGKRVKEREFVDQKTGEPVKKSVLPDAGPSVTEEWANAQKPKMAIAN